MLFYKYLTFCISDNLCWISYTSLLTLRQQFIIRTILRMLTLSSLVTTESKYAFQKKYLCNCLLQNNICLQTLQGYHLTLILMIIA